MTTKAQELKKELAQAFPGLKFSVKTDKGITTRIDVIVTGLMGSPYTMSEIKLVTNKYHNYRTHGHNDSHTGNTQVHVKNERSYYLKEIKEMVPNYENNWETVHKIADNECFTVLPDGYYEEKMSLQNPQPQEVIDSAVTETIEKETIDDTVVKTVKEIKPKNKIAKLQTKLIRLESQLKITKGDRAKAKIVIEILKVESAIEQLIPEEKEITLTWEQEKSLNALTVGKFIFSKLTQESKKELLKIVNELEDLEREKYRDDCTGKGLWKRPSKASIKRSEKRSNKYRLLRERVEQLELIQENPVEVKDITVKIPVSVSTLKKHCKVPSSELTDEEIINGWKYSLAAQSMQRDFRTQKDIQWGDRHLLLNIVYFVDQYQQEMDKRGLTEKYCLWIEKKQVFKDEFCKKPEKTTIEFLKSKFKDAQVDITDKQIILKSETTELAINLSFEIPDINDYYNQYRRAKTIKNLKQNQTPKIHSVCEYIGSILLTA